MPVDIILEEAARVGMTETRLTVPRFARDLDKRRGVYIPVSDLKLMDDWFSTNAPIEIDAYWRFLRFTGCRICEAEKLYWRDIADDEVAIHASKTGKLRYLPLPDVDYLKQDKPPQQKVFNFSQGVFRDRHFKPMLKELGLEGKGYATKSVRHNAATDLIKQGHSVFDVKDFMGHSTINTTMKYLHASGNNNKKMKVR